jgi:hypothetical protein
MPTAQNVRVSVEKQHFRIKPEVREGIHKCHPAWFTELTHLHYIHKFSLYLTGNTFYLYNSNKSVNIVQGITIFRENHVKHVNYTGTVLQ